MTAETTGGPFSKVDLGIVEYHFEAVSGHAVTGSAVERLGEPVKIYETNVPNLKITTVEDLQLAAAVVLKR